MNAHVHVIGRNDFITSLPKLQAIVAKCTFVAIDTEMGGISLPDCRSSVMDSIQTRYTQYRVSAQQFPLVQFGLCCFTWDSVDKIFQVDCFQFPIFPRYEKLANNHEQLPDRRFLLQPMCVQYIREHGFDLNAWIDDGIGYLSHQDQEKYREVLTKSSKPAILTKFDQQTTSTLITAETQSFLDGVIIKLKKHFGPRLSSPLQQKEKRSGDDVVGSHFSTPEDLEWKREVRTMRIFLQTPVDNAKTLSNQKQHGASQLPAVFLTGPLAPFRRHTLIEQLQTTYPNLLALDCCVDNEDEEITKNPWRRRVRLILPSTIEQREWLLQAHQQIAQHEMDERNLKLIGFTAVMDVLVNAKKPLVGHNLLLDVMQCFEKFHHPLPAQCEEFQHQLYGWLVSDTSDGGGLFDTKEMATYAIAHIDSFANHLQHTALEHVFQALSNSPFHGAGIRIQSIDQFSSLSANLQAHQAGYDAFMTGFVFLRICCGLGIDNNTIASLGSSSPSNIDSRLQRFHNILHVSHFLPTYVLQLPGPFPKSTSTPSRANILRLDLVRTWSAGLKTFHIKQCLGWALDLHSAKQMQVHWEGKRCVYVSFPSASYVEKLLAIRNETAECNGSDKDPMPSIGCVDLYRCTSADNPVDNNSTDGKSPEYNGSSSHDGARKKRKNSERDA